MKRLILSTLTLFMFVFTLGLAHDVSRKWEKLAADLRLGPAQRVHYDAYFKEMHTGVTKAHEEARRAVQKILTPEQYATFTKDMQAMKRSDHPLLMSDDQVKAVVDQESKKLLLTANQESQLELVGLTLHHKEEKLLDQFVSRLSKQLNKPQQDKLNAFWAQCH